MTVLYPRWQKHALEQALKTSQVVLLAGVRQCGKTTLAKQLISEDAPHLTLDNSKLKKAAETDPQDFVKQKSKTLLIDEIQRVPSLLPAIKKNVDENTRAGQYLLTASGDIETLPSAQESLAGRISKIRLRPLCMGEIIGSTPNFLSHAFKQSFDFRWDFHEKNSLINMAFRGGFPEALALEDHARKKWHKEYIEAFLSRDLEYVADIRRYDAITQVADMLKGCSRRCIDVSVISPAFPSDRPTLSTYVNALEALYLVERVLPWTKTDYYRVGKQAKLFITDSGLMTSILSWNQDKVRFDSNRLGKVMETFIFNELSAQIDASEGEYELYHYRDREQREIDFLIEREDQAILGIEVQSNSSVQKNDFKHLKWFQEHLAKDRPFVGIVLYSGSLPFCFGQNLWAIPISMLWTPHPMAS
jgi:uncharacterized protein